MKFYKVTTIEYRGFDCFGHYVPHIVYANNKKEAVELMNLRDHDDEPDVEEFVLPDISRKRKGGIIT